MRRKAPFMPGIFFTPRVFEEAATYQQQIRWLKKEIDELKERVTELENPTAEE